MNSSTLSDSARLGNPLDVPPAWSGTAPVTDTIPLSIQGADVLPPGDRDLFERTRVKAVLAMVYVAAAFMFLGFCAVSGAYSNYFSGIVKKGQYGKVLWFAPANLIAKYEILALIGGTSKLTPAAQGYGFATFCFFSAFILALTAAVIISPWCTGTKREKVLLSAPKSFIQS